MKRPDESEVERLRDMIGMNVKPRAKPELIDAMEQASAKRIIYLFAPSGYGKTASALRWLEKQAARQAWIDLGEEDNDPAVFYSRLAKEALRAEKTWQILVLDRFQEVINKVLKYKKYFCKKLALTGEKFARNLCISDRVDTP